MNDIDELITFEPYQSCYEYGYEQGSADEREKVIEEIISQADIKISESHIWNLIVSRSTKDASDLSDKIVDYFMEMIKEIAEELKEKNNEQTKEV